MIGTKKHIYVKKVFFLQDKGYHFTQKAFDKNSYQLADLFTNETVAKLRNGNNYQVFEVKSLFIGKSFVVCPLREIPIEGSEYFQLQKGFFSFTFLPLTYDYFTYKTASPFIYYLNLFIIKAGVFENINQMITATNY